MKLVRFATIIAVAGVAQVLAVPLLVITSVPGNPAHAVQMPDNTPKSGGPAPMGRMRRPCGGANRLNQKAVELSNFFRQALGLPLIAGGHPGHRDGDVRILPFVGTPSTFAPAHAEMEGGVKVYNFSNIPHPRPHHAPHGHGHHRLGGGSFVNRIHYSLMNLGRWEGRAVAFVLGCGIGVLLRMIFVLGVVMYRAVKGQRGDEHEYSQITIIEEIVDTPKSAPPTYTYTVDEKVAIAIETIKAPSTTEESK